MIGREKVTIFEGVPTMYSALLHHPDRATADVSSLRLCVSGGAALPVEVLREFEEAFGCTDPGGLRAVRDLAGRLVQPPGRGAQAGLDRHPYRRRGDARCRTDSGADVPPGEVGEIAIRGHNVMKGYWGKPEATAAAIPDGWFRTGDLARIDEDGYFFIVDRKKELIIRGGYNVYPREIEEALYEHPAVAEVAVVGIPHDSLGEEVGAAVALKPGATATPDELRAFAKEPARRLQVPAARLAGGRAAEGTDRQDPAPRGPARPRRSRAGAARDRARRADAQRQAEDFADVADDVAPALDLLLSDAALGVLRRFRPDCPWLRFGLRLARQPCDRDPPGCRAGRRAGQDRGRALRARPAPHATAGSPTRPGRATRSSGASCRPTWPAPTLAESLLADAELDWRTASASGSSCATWSTRPRPATTRCSARSRGRRSSTPAG